MQVKVKLIGSYLRVFLPAESFFIPLLPSSFSLLAPAPALSGVFRFLSFLSFPLFFPHIMQADRREGQKWLEGKTVKYICSVVIACVTPPPFHLYHHHTGAQADTYTDARHPL